MQPHCKHFTATDLYKDYGEPGEHARVKRGEESMIKEPSKADKKPKVKASLE